MRKIGIITKAALMLVLLFSLAGCDEREEKKEREDIAFTVCAREQLPEELYNIIEEKKHKVCKFTYANGSNMYMVVCYGEKERENLNVVVNELFMTSNAIYLDTTLKTASGSYNEEDMGEATGLNAQQSSDYNTVKGACSMYPYIVIKCEKYDVPVVFDID